MSLSHCSPPSARHFAQPVMTIVSHHSFQSKAQCSATAGPSGCAHDITTLIATPVFFYFMNGTVLGLPSVPLGEASILLFCMINIYGYSHRGGSCSKNWDPCKRRIIVDDRWSSEETKSD
eukprot:658287-Pelagomonas_calceolata.AAC.3